MENTTGTTAPLTATERDALIADLQHRIAVQREQNRRAQALGLREAALAGRRAVRQWKAELLDLQA